MEHQANRTRKVAAMSATEASARFASELHEFASDFIVHHRETFAHLAPCPPTGNGSEEHEHQWHQSFALFRKQADTAVQLAAQKWGLMQEPAFSPDFVEWAAADAHKFDALMAATDYQKFISLVRRTLHPGHSQQLGSGPQPAAPLPKEVRAIDERLAAIEHERTELMRERKKLLGRGGMASPAVALQQSIERQRYRDEVGLD